MTTLPPAAEPYLKPLPEITDFNRPFFDALRSRRFVVPKCHDCGDYSWIPYPACRTCQSENIEWTPVSGDATLYSFTVIHNGPGAYATDVPYVAAIGELVEQPRPCLVLANVVGSTPEELAVGQPLEIVYQDVPGEDITLYHWAVKR